VREREKGREMGTLPLFSFLSFLTFQKLAPVYLTRRDFERDYMALQK
jgi:hypothetical protein